MKNHKKIISLSMISVFMIFGSVAQADNDVMADAVMMNDASKPSSKKCHHNENSYNRANWSGKKWSGKKWSGKEMMQHIEHRLEKIKEQYRSGEISQEEANKSLDRMPAKIQRAVAKMKREEDHVAMYKRHQKRLNNELKKARKYVNSKQVKNNNK